MTKFYFNTGVNPTILDRGLYGNQVVRNGTVQIPFECDAPEGSIFKFACDDPSLPDGVPYEIKKPNPCLLSKYAYFQKTSG